MTPAQVRDRVHEVVSWDAPNCVITVAEWKQSSSHALQRIVNVMGVSNHPVAVFGPRWTAAVRNLPVKSLLPAAIDLIIASMGEPRNPADWVVIAKE